MKLTQSYDFVVLGGSLPGLVGALLLKRRQPAARILVVDAAERPGGLLLGHQVLDDHFDAGTHILQEIGDYEVDQIIESAIRPEYLLKTESSIGDYAATLYRNQIWTSTSFPDVIGRSKPLAKQIVSEITNTVFIANTEESRSESTHIRQKNARSVSIQRYGITATESVIQPIIERMFGSASDLSGFALELCNLMRLNLVELPEWISDVQTRGLSDRIAYPDQKQLPKELRHNKHSLYSIRNGARDFVEGLIRMCENESIEVAASTKIEIVDIKRNEFRLVTANESVKAEFGVIISCLGPTQTMKVLGEDQNQMIERLPYRIFHIHMKKPLSSSVCYFYAQDSNSLIFRITNYIAFSGRESDTRLSIETIGGDHLSDLQMQVAIEQELIENGIIEEGSVQETVCVRSMNGYPVPSVRLFESYASDASKVKDFEQDGIFTTGVGMAEGIFFQNEILKHLTSIIRFIS